MRITLQACCAIVDLVLAVAIHAKIARLDQSAIEEIFNGVELDVRTFYRLQQKQRGNARGQHPHIHCIVVYYSTKLANSNQNKSTQRQGQGQ